MEAPQGAGEKRISEPHEEAGLCNGVHAFGAESQKRATWVPGSRLCFRMISGG
jgi:hypothetical protein